ncbi:MAG: zinc-binding dehydrogenase [Vicinamibacterales bacterium]
MPDTSTRLADLSPEQRQRLLDRLASRATQTTAAKREPAVAAWPSSLSADENVVAEFTQPGILDSLRFTRVPRKAPGRGQLEIEVHAAALNFRDVMIALGMYPTSSGAAAQMGSDCSGTVVAVGPEVTEWRVGDEVVALSNGLCRYSLAVDAAVARKPAAMTHESAATIPTVFLTAYYGLRHLAHLAANERVLIHSAAGGVGLAAIQIARSLGADIIATAGTEEKRQFVRSLGITHVFDSRSLAFAADVLRVTERRGVDVVLNSLAGEAIAKGVGLLRPLGRFVELGKRDIYQNFTLGLSPFRKALSFHALELGMVVGQRPSLFRSMFADVLGAFAAGTFTPLPATTFGIGDLKSAIEHMSQGTHRGKVAVRVKGDA